MVFGWEVKPVPNLLGVTAMFPLHVQELSPFALKILQGQQQFFETIKDIA